MARSDRMGRVERGIEERDREEIKGGRTKRRKSQRFVGKTQKGRVADKGVVGTTKRYMQTNC